MKYDWNNISKSKKVEVGSQKYIFIAGSIRLSDKRLNSLIEKLSAKSKVLLGILKDDFILGLEDSPQFRTNKSLLEKGFRDVLEVDTLEYFQRDAKYIFEELAFAAVIFVNGSWYRQIHQTEELWKLINNKTPYKFVSPFSNEKDAKEFELNLQKEISSIIKLEEKKKYSDKELIKFANLAAKQSYDWTFQTGAVLAKDGKVLLYSHNKVMPYETYAMHFGSNREKSFSPIGDLNNYDTLHAEMVLLSEALNKNFDIEGSTLYINLLPCPACAKMLASTKIKEIVYKLDHSDGDAVKMLEASGKIVRRLV